MISILFSFSPEISSYVKHTKKADIPKFYIGIAPVLPTTFNASF